MLSECNNKQNYVKFDSFTPLSGKKYDITQLESRSGCDSQPYSVMYTIKNDNEKVFLKLAPSENSENVENKPVQQPLVKIKTVNNYWVYVALYDASMPNTMSHVKGYLKINDLKVAN